MEKNPKSIPKNCGTGTKNPPSKDPAINQSKKIFLINSFSNSVEKILYF
jgi:hypothetical protein